MLFTLSRRLDGFKQHSLMTIRTQIRRQQTEAKSPSLKEQIHTLDYRQPRPSIWIPSPEKNAALPDPRLWQPFHSRSPRAKVNTNSRTRFPKHGPHYCFQAGKLESCLTVLRDSRTFATITSLSATLLPYSNMRSSILPGGVCSSAFRKSSMVRQRWTAATYCAETS